MTLFRFKHYCLTTNKFSSGIVRTLSKRNRFSIGRWAKFVGHVRCPTIILHLATRITNHSNTLIDNLFSNSIDPGIISGNLTATTSDHLPQFAIIPNMFGNISGNKSNIYERDWSKFDLENFILDYFSVELEGLLKIDQLNADNSTKMHLDEINMLLDTSAPQN